MAAAAARAPTLSEFPFGRSEFPFGRSELSPPPEVDGPSAEDDKGAPAGWAPPPSTSFSGPETILVSSPFGCCEFDIFADDDGGSWLFFRLGRVILKLVVPPPPPAELVLPGGFLMMVTPDRTCAPGPPGEGVTLTPELSCGECQELPGAEAGGAKTGCREG